MRTLFLIFGFVLLLCGLELLLVDKFQLYMASDEDLYTGVRTAVLGEPVDQQRVIDPPRWTSYSLISAGLITVIYGFGSGRRYY